MNSKRITLKPERRFFIWWYVTGILLLPLLGSGLLLIWIAFRKRFSTTFIISDREITVHSGKSSKKAPIAEINRSEVRQRWTDRRMGTGTLLLYTDTDSLELPGIENPDTVSSLILKAAKAERDRLTQTPKPKETPPSHPPGTLDKLDYLTGLWQQGLLSDEDYQKERKHFEN